MTEAVYRVDYQGKLGKLQRTPQGGVRVPATIARVGVLEYGDGKGGVVREYNPPEVLQAALDSLRDAPVTNEHPPELVSPKNFKKYAAGFVSGSVEFKDGMIHAVLAVQDESLIADIDANVRREVSAGYSAHVDPTPGVSPEGQPYDAIRTRIDFNHAAVVTAGRAGNAVRLVLDSAGHVHIPGAESSSANATLETSMSVKIKVDGVEHAVESAQAVIDGAFAKRDSAVSKLDTDLAAAQTALATSEAKVKELEAKLTEATSATKIDGLVTARLGLIESARKVCGKDFKADGKTEAQIVSEVAAKANPKLKLDDKSEAYVRALFDAAVSADASDPDGLLVLRGDRVDPKATTDTKDTPAVAKTDAKSARAEMLAHNQSLAAQK